MKAYWAEKKAMTDTKKMDAVMTDLKKTEAEAKSLVAARLNKQKPEPWWRRLMQSVFSGA